MNQLKLDHIGLNAANKGDALVLAQAFCQLLGCPIEEKPASVYAGPSVEVMAGGGRGESGGVLYLCLQRDSALQGRGCG